MYSEPETWHALMERLGEIVIAFARGQIAAGVEAFQLFDSWIGALGPREYARFVQPHVRHIFAALAGMGVPLIYFCTRTTPLLGLMAQAGGGPGWGGLRKTPAPRQRPVCGAA